jgi:divalent metal cation (Fe/Co/Zn/Cd) transporter
MHTIPPEPRLEELDAGAAHASWRVSLVSVVWTVLASCVAIALGIASDSAALVAFGAIGFVDALGSAGLVYHFRHALRHETLSERVERNAHRLVVMGLFSVGMAAVIAGIVRLVGDDAAESSGAGTVLAGTSIVVLATLSVRKQVLARRVGSHALLADGHLSGVGALQAGVTLFGTAAARWLGWDWADAVAAGIVGLVAISVAIASTRAARQR